MSRHSAAWVLFFMAVASAAVPALAADPPPARGPLSVFVQARPDETERSASEKELLRTKADAAGKSVDQLHKDLKKQFGKDAKKWPEEKVRGYYEARDALGVAWSESYYYARPAAEKTDSVEDFRKHLAKDRKNKYVTLASSREDADLVVEVMGRKGMAKFIRGSKYLGFDVLPGRIRADALVNLPRERLTPWWADHFSTLHWPRTAEPFFRFEVNDAERWQDVAEYGVLVVEEVAKAYYDALKPAP